MADINWDAIRTEYITSDTSCASLAKKYGIHHSSVCRKAKRYHWDEEKAQMRNEKRRIVQEKTIEAQVNLADKCLNILNIMVDKATEAAMICEPSDIRGQKDIMSIIKDLNDMGAFALENKASNEVTIRFADEVDEL